MDLRLYTAGGAARKQVRPNVQFVLDEMRQLRFVELERSRLGTLLIGPGGALITGSDS